MWPIRSSKKHIKSFISNFNMNHSISSLCTPDLQTWIGWLYRLGISARGSLLEPQIEHLLQNTVLSTAFLSRDQNDEVTLCAFWYDSHHQHPLLYKEAFRNHIAIVFGSNGTLSYEQFLSILTRDGYLYLPKSEKKVMPRFSTQDRAISIRAFVEAVLQKKGKLELWMNIDHWNHAIGLKRNELPLWRGIIRSQY